MGPHMVLNLMWSTARETACHVISSSCFRREWNQWARSGEAVGVHARIHSGIVEGARSALTEKVSDQVFSLSTALCPQEICGPSHSSNKEKQSYVCIRVAQPQHREHFGQNNSVL